nr:PREDICTED: uncharacterized protein LOC102350003 isoform X2 [Latimeria chalumnae]|eukprot:XP_014346065.1 PREDICTED: uncharacterized protein LOC102350003 isoform X2 [Latimeria chalumnae]
MRVPEMIFIFIALMRTLPYHMGSQDLRDYIGSQGTSHKADQQLLINEVNPNSPGLGTKEYIELYHTNSGRVSLDGYVMVLYNGNGNRAYKVLNLAGFMTNDKGFFLIGSSSVVPKPTIIPSNTIQDGPDGIALYYGGGPYYEGMKVTNVGLVDAIVHKTKKNDKADVLSSVLTPGKEAFLEDAFFRINNKSIERCLGPDLQWIFQMAKPSPGKENFCSSFWMFNLPSVVLNEVRTKASPDDFEFIELRGLPSTSLNGLVLVLMERATDMVYYSMDVTGKTSSNGLFLIGPAGSNIPVNQPFPVTSRHSLLRKGPAAVALYSGDSSDFQPGTPLMDKHLIDALVYGNRAPMDQELLDSLTPGKIAFPQSSISLPGGSSISRCDCCQLVRDSAAYVGSSPTPGQSNDCPTRNFHQKITYCLKVTECSLWVPDSQVSYDIRFSLAGNIENICSCGVSMGYIKDSSIFCQGAGLVFKALLIAKSSSQLQQLHSAFHTHVGREETIIIAGRSAVVDQDCLHVQGRLARSFGSSPEPTLLISEVNSNNPGTKEDAEYIEFIHTGKAAATKLDDYWLVFYNGRDNRAYHVLNLTGHQTSAGGYFLVGSAGMSPTPGITIPVKFIQNGPDGVAIYKKKKAKYRKGMKVTNLDLVDAVVYTARFDDSVDDLLNILTPGEKVLQESHRFQGGKTDESLSRCRSFQPRSQKSFELSSITPLQDNTCNSTTLPPDDNLMVGELQFLDMLGNFLINELNTVNGSEMGAFIELKVPPRANMNKYVVVLYDGTDQTAYAVIYLQGLSSADGYFVIGSPQGFTPDQLLLEPLREGPGAVALYYGGLEDFSVGIRVTKEKLLDAVVYAFKNDTAKGLLDVLTPNYLAVQKYKSSLDGITALSRCSCCDMNLPTVYGLTDPTPGAMNDCPTNKFILGFSLYLQTPNCSILLPDYEETLYELKMLLVRGIEDQCQCGFSMVYLSDLEFICENKMLIFLGNFLAKSQAQLQLIREGYLQFISRQQFIYVAGNEMGINKSRSGVSTEPKKPRSPSATIGPNKKTSMEAWKVGVTVVGVLLSGLMATLSSVYYAKRDKVNAAIRNLRERIRPSTVAPQ